VDLSLLTDIFALTLFIVGFRPLARRVGAHADLWFAGFGFVLLGKIASLLQPLAPWLEQPCALIAALALALCALTFLIVAANVPRERLKRPVLIALVTPVLLEVSVTVLRPHLAWLEYLSCGLFLAPLVVVLSFPRRRTRALLLVGVTFALYALAALPLAVAHPAIVADASISLVFLSAAYFYLVAAPHYSRSVVAAAAGLVSWGLLSPLQIVLRRIHPEWVLGRGLTTLPQFLVAAGIMLTLLEEHVLRTERMAMHDPLTDLPNRRMFEERLIATMEEARLTRTTVACLVIDVDNFKAVNDTLGHTAGDELLRALAVRLSWHMSPRDILARTGGDEFTALLAGVTDEHHLRFIAGAMMSAGSVPVLIDGQAVDLRISIGIALSPDHADDIDGLRRAADAAMYSAKRRGGSLLAFAGED
jgi:diguanylate cyclase (GGDEF)-like protein